MAVSEAQREKAAEVYEKLLDTYGERPLRVRPNALRVLISTILSQRTTARGERKAFEQMWTHYRSWTAIRDAPTDELAALLRPANYSATKAQRIQAVLERLLDEKGRASLTFLKDISADEGVAYLTSLPGVGLKTASIVLLFNFAKAVQPVDTHVHRVSTRLGLIPKVSADKAHGLLRDLYPENAHLHYNLHVCLIHHGRRVCKSKAPRCERCAVAPWCDYVQT